MNISKDALEGMASILRENGYEVALKKSETKESDIKMPYDSHRFNKIRDLDLGSPAYDTCLFLSATVVHNFKLHDYIAGSSAVTIGYIERVNDCDILENLSDYDYVIKLSDVFNLMASNEDFND